MECYTFSLNVGKAGLLGNFRYQP